jgi:hypothetical protein
MTPEQALKIKWLADDYAAAAAAAAHATADACARAAAAATAPTADDATLATLSFRAADAARSRQEDARTTLHAAIDAATEEVSDDPS